MSESYDFGRWAEQQAVDYLKREGYTILERNYRYLKAEIDIIAQIQDILTITEVKARRNVYFGSPETFVKKKKRQLLYLATDYYLNIHKINIEVRFDIIAIVRSAKQTKLSHIKNAFYPHEE